MKSHGARRLWQAKGLQRALGVLLLVALCSEAVAQGGAAALEKGKKALAEGEFERVLRVLDPQKGKHPEESAEMHLLRAQAFQALQKSVEARAELERALLRLPTFELDAEQVGPTIAQIFEDARSRLSGELEIAGPPASEVDVDGIRRGPAPLKLHLRVGRHRVHAQAPDGASFDAEVVVPAKELVRLQLPPSPEWTRPATEPPPGHAALSAPAHLAAPEGTRPASGVGARASLRRRAWIPAAVGGVLLGSGVAALVVARERHSQLTEGVPQSFAEAEDTQRSGRRFERLGWVAGGAGLTALLVAGGLYYLGGSPEPELVPTVTWYGGGAGVGLARTFE